MRLHLSDAPWKIPGTAGTEASIADASGNVVIASLTVSSDGFLTIPALELDDYVVSWADGTSVRFSVSSAPYFTIEQFRSFDPNLSSSVSDSDIEDVREHVEDVFDTAAGRAFCMRSARETMFGNGMDRVLASHLMPLEIVSALVDGSSVSARISGKRIVFPTPVASMSVISIHYVFGCSETPASLAHNAMLFADSLIGTPSVNPRATGMQSEFGYARFAVAGKDGPTGIPEVDAFLSADPSKGGHGVRAAMLL